MLSVPQDSCCRCPRALHGSGGTVQGRALPAVRSAAPSEKDVSGGGVGRQGCPGELRVRESGRWFISSGEAVGSHVSHVYSSLLKNIYIVHLNVLSYWK